MRVEMETVVSIRGKRKIMLNGYVYVKQKNLAKGAISYECELRRGSGRTGSICKARVKLAHDLSILEFVNEHSHAPNEAHCEVLQVRAHIKRRAVQTEEPAQQILGLKLQHLSQQAAVELTPLPTIRRAIRSCKQKVNAVHPLPKTRSFPIPDEYKTLDNGEDFLLYDSGQLDPNRIIVFGTNRAARLLIESQNWFMDGTFKIVPQLFYQLYSVHALNRGDVIPCLYVLLSNKTEDTYTRLFTDIKALIPALDPLTVTMDYEKAAMNAATAAFPNAVINGCFYHLAQSVYRNVQAAGLQQRYQVDADFALAARMLPALAFVPIPQVIDYFETVQANAPDALAPVIDYFEDNYVGRLRRQGRRAAPRYPIAVWNVHDRVENDLPRTNNSVEGWNRKMQTAVSGHHPNIWRFLGILKREQNINNAHMDQLLGGHEPPPQRKKYRDCNTRIVTIARDFYQRDALQYLRGVAHNISF